MSIDASLWKCCWYSLWVPSDSQDWSFWSPQWPSSNCSCHQHHPISRPLRSLHHLLRAVPGSGNTTFLTSSHHARSPGSSSPLHTTQSDPQRLWFLLPLTNEYSPKLHPTWWDLASAARAKEARWCNLEQPRVSAPWSKYWPTRTMRWEGTGRQSRLPSSLQQTVPILIFWIACLELPWVTHPSPFRRQWAPICISFLASFTVPGLHLPINH